jgi:hypothetical protein
MSSVRFSQTDDSLWKVSFRLEDGILLDQVSDLYDLGSCVSNIVSNTTNQDTLVQRVRFRVRAASSDDVLYVVKRARWLLTYS